MKIALLFHRTLLVFTLLVLLTGLVPLAPAQPAIANDAATAEAAVPSTLSPLLLKDIYTGNPSSNPRYLASLGSQFFFSASSPTYGTGLWVSDGTLAGTQMVTNFSYGAGSSLFTDFAVFHGKFFYIAGYNLYATDGTPANTTLVYSAESNINKLELIGDWLYVFSGGSSLKRYNDLTGTIESISLNDVQFQIVDDSTAVMNGSLYFQGANATSGYELWRLDGTSGQVSLVKDICSGVCLNYSDYYQPEGSLPHSMTVVGSNLFFLATDDTHGTEVWVSNGSEAGTILLKDIYAGTEGTAPESLTAAGSWLYFSADDGSPHGLELWRSDGTPANTALVADIAPGPLSSSPQNLIYQPTGNQLYFAARDAATDQGHGQELWFVPITAKGVTANPQMLEIAPGSASSFPSSFAILGNTVYFAAQDTPGNTELWKSGGQPSNTVQVADLMPGPDGSDPQNLGAWNSKLVFSAADEVHGRELWTSDGTTEGTAMLIDLVDSLDIDGSDSLVSSWNAGIITNVGGSQIRYFPARDALHGEELWRTDGSSGGTWMVKDIYPGSTGGLSYGTEMVELNGILYFSATDPEHGADLWRSDGTSAGTWLVIDLDPGAESDCPDYLTPVGNTLFFIVHESDSIPKLYATDGTAGGTRLVKSFPKTLLLPIGVEMAAMGNTLIFNVNDRDLKTAQLWRSDGTPAGTQAFYGPFNYSDSKVLGPIDWMTSLGGKVYMDMSNTDIPVGVDEEGTDRLWVTDGTAAGTNVIGPSIDPFPYQPENLILVGENLFFTAFSSKSGEYFQEEFLWKLPTGSTTPSQVDEIWGQKSDYLTSLSENTLLLLAHDIYGYVYTWWTIDIPTNARQEICDTCSYTYITMAGEGLGMVFFNGTNIYSGSTELWATDGTSAGVTKVNLPEGVKLKEFQDSFIGNSRVFYFAATDPQHGNEPWVIRTKMDYAQYLPFTRR